jgi:hypothetical protein
MIAGLAWQRSQKGGLLQACRHAGQPRTEHVLQLNVIGEGDSEGRIF